MNTIFIFLIVAILAMFVIAQVIFKKLQSKKLSETKSNSDVEQMVNAYRNGLKYKKARTRLWELMIIVPAVIALLGTGGYIFIEYRDNIRTSMPHFLEQDDEYYNEYYKQEFQAYKQTMVNKAKGWLEKDQQKFDNLIKVYPYSWVRTLYEEDVKKSEENLQKAKDYSFETYIQEANGKYIMFKLLLLIWFMLLVLQIVLYCVSPKQNHVVKYIRTDIKIISGIIFLTFLINIIFGTFTWTESSVLICIGILSMCL